MLSIIELQHANITLKVLPKIGGRIVFLSKNSEENILESDKNKWDDFEKPELNAFSDFKPYNGHEIWLGPQCDWWKYQDLNEERKANASVWPPDPFIIYGEYTIEHQTKNAIILVGPESPISGIQLRKEIVINDDGTVYQNVIATNTSKKLQSWDLWFNTRLNGLCKAYVPLTEKPDDLRVVINQLGSSDAMPCKTDNNIFRFVATNPTPEFHDRSSKAFIYPSKNYMVGFTKKHAIKILFEQHQRSQIHPEQGLVEIYNYTDGNDSNSLLEMEYHSAYTQLKPGETMQAWEVWEISEYSGLDTESEHLEFISKL